MFVLPKIVGSIVNCYIHISYHLEIWMLFKMGANVCTFVLCVYGLGEYQRYFIWFLDRQRLSLWLIPFYVFMVYGLYDIEWEKLRYILTRKYMNFSFKVDPVLKFKFSLNFHLLWTQFLKFKFSLNFHLLWIQIYLLYF